MMKTKVWYVWRLLGILLHLTAAVVFGLGLSYQYIYPTGHAVKLNVSVEDDGNNTEATNNSASNDSLVTDNSTAKDNSTDVDRSFAWKWKFLTFWDLNLQFLLFTVFLICDLIPANYQVTKEIYNHWLRAVFRIRDAVFHSLAFPIGWFVCLTFWILYSIDRELIMPRSEDGKYPPWINHVQHTIIAPILVTESLLTFHFVPHKVLGIFFLLVLILAYLAWIMYLGLRMDIWVYGILKVLSWPLRISFLVGCGMAMIILYLIGESIHRYLWPKERRQAFQYSRWSSHTILSKEHEFEDFRIVQGLIKKS